MILLLMEDARREVDDAQAQLRLTHDHLRRAALYDSLTDSLNRRAFSEGVGLEMARAAYGTVVMADLDNLKQSNDQHGHAFGDQLIRRSADIIRTCLRPYDKLYRWGDDEFMLVIPSAHASDVLDRVRHAIESAEPIPVGAPGEFVRLQVSLGAADYASSEDLSVAIERADAAMYREKVRRRAISRIDGPDGELSAVSPIAVEL
jgi:diguanylate cyclase (GGDEF)-like protein